MARPNCYLIFPFLNPFSILPLEKLTFLKVLTLDPHNKLLSKWSVLFILFSLNAYKIVESSLKATTLKWHYKPQTSLKDSVILRCSGGKHDF